MAIKIFIPDDYPKDEMVKIEGSEVSFSIEVSREELLDKAKDIWNHPSRYSDYQDNSEGAYYSFLKYLWIIFPEGRQVQLAEYVIHGNK